MNNVVCFLLCFAEEKIAFNLFCFLIEKKYPNNFFLKSKHNASLIGL